VTRGSLYIVGAALIFSCGGLFVKLAAMPPTVLVGWRTLVPLIAVALMQPELLRSFFVRPHPVLLVVSVLSALRVSVWVFGLLLAPISKAAVMLYTWPLIFTLLSAVFLGEPITRRSMGLLLLGFGGVLVMCLDQAGLSDEKQRLGLLLMLCVAAVNAINFLIIKTQLKSRELGEVLLYDNLVGACVFLPFVLSNVGSVPPTSIVWLACYGGLLGCGGYYLLYSGLRRVSASMASVLCYVEVVGAGFLGVVVFGEPVTWRMLVSAAMILTAAFLVRIGSRNARAS
jgi:drug/metabolite transporter (DMT)-like permease